MSLPGGQPETEIEGYQVSAQLSAVLAQGAKNCQLSHSMASQHVSIYSMSRLYPSYRLRTVHPPNCLFLSPTTLRKELYHERKVLAGRCYQLLSGHSAISDYLCNKVHKLPSDSCRWCDRSETNPLSPLYELPCLGAPGPRDMERLGHPLSGSTKGRPR